MARTPLLSEAEVGSALAALPGWARNDAEIEKTFERASFPDAIAFVVRIGFLAGGGRPSPRYRHPVAQGPRRVDDA